MPQPEGGGKLIVYLDLVVILNFLVDFLLLLGTNRLSGHPPGPGRCALAAALGAAYSGACMLPGFRFLGSLLWRLVSLALMGALAFGLDRSALKRGGTFLLLSLALGGAALSLGRGDFLALLLSAAGLGLLCRLAFGAGPGGRQYVPLTLDYGGRSVRLTALRDSGNTLRDPITGERVFLIGSAPACRLTGLTPEQLGSPLETLTQRPIPGLRLIPYRAVGSAGLLLGLRLREVDLDGRRQSAVVAFAPEGLDGSYQALVTAD